MVRWAAMWAVLCATATANADEITKQNYPLALLDRPLVLPKFVFEPSAELVITDSSATTTDGATDSGTSALLAVALDVGLSSRFQAGIFLSLPLSPVAGIGTLSASGQFLLTRSIALRADAGLEEQLFADVDGSGATSRFVAGFGAPMRWRLGSWLALVSGKSGAARFIVPRIVSLSNNGEAVYFGGATGGGSTDLVYANLGSNFQFLEVNVPVGVVFQPHERVAIEVRAGYSVLMKFDAMETLVQQFVPVGAEVNVAILRQLEAGIAFDMAGMVHTSEALPSVAYSYAGQRTFTVRAAGRF